MAGAASAESPKNVKVAILFQSASTGSTRAVDPSARVVITERGRVRGRGSVGVDDSTTRVRQTTSIFTIAQDGSEGRMLVATEVPYPEVVFFYDYAVGRGYFAQGVQFHQVATSLVVRPSILPDGMIRVRLTPHITYLSATGGGGVELTEATTELIVPNGTPVSLGGASQELHALTRRILGYRATQTSGELSMAITASVQ